MKRRGRGTYKSDKPPILGVVGMGGQVRLLPLTDVVARTVLRRLFKGFDLDDVETYITDNYPTYSFLKGFGCHEKVNHSTGEYARGSCHTNTVEGEFSVFI